MSYDLFFNYSSDDEDEVNSELAFFTEACSAVIEASKPKISRTQIDRDRYGAHDRLVAAYFSEHPVYDEATFRTRFRMNRTIFTKIVREVIDHSRYFQQRPDCSGRVGISPLMKCTSAIRQMAYGAVPDALNEYLQMGASTARECLVYFCDAIMELYGEEFLRKPTYTDLEKLYARHEEKHGFPVMIASIDCTDWPWENCPVAFKAQYCRRDHGPDPFILLQAIASQYLWIWHAFFGVSGMNNDVNVLRKSPIFNDLKEGKAPDVPFVANDVNYKRGYYLTDGIYPEWSVLIKSIKNPRTNDHKRKLYKTKHEAARKDVEREGTMPSLANGKLGNDSGSSDLIKYQQACAEYEAQYGHAFTLEPCWQVLRDHPAWKDVEMPAFYKTHKKLKTSETTSGSGHGEAGGFEEEVREVRPIGRDQVKKKLSVAKESLVDLVIDKWESMKSSSWVMRKEQQDSYILLKNRELDIQEAARREAAELKKKKLALQRRAVELAERKKRDKDILFYNSQIDPSLPELQQQKLLEMKKEIKEYHNLDY